MKLFGPVVKTEHDAEVSLLGTQLVVLSSQLIVATPGTEEYKQLQGIFEAVFERHAAATKLFTALQPWWYRLLMVLIPPFAFVTRWTIFKPLNGIKRLAYFAAHFGRDE